MDARQYDIIVYGATGFTGQLVAEYLEQKDEPFSWAIAGRNQEKLMRVKQRAGLSDDVGVMVADSADFASLTRMTAAARVLLTTVGPYALYGEPLVKACIETGTDYVDITGEPEFVDNLLRKLHDAAVERQVRIINCCGFDSIPHDMGVYFTMQQMPNAGQVKLEGFVTGNGTFSGGTWASAVEAMGNLRRLSGGPKGSVAEGRKVGGVKGGVRRESQINGYAVPLPTIDPQVVLRSARALDFYGREFQYGHYARVKSPITLAVGGVALGGIVGLAQFKPTRNLLLKVRPSGEGPDAETRAKSSFSVTFIGQVDDATIRTKVSGGDPGYGETSKMIAESALALVLDRDQLPNAYGVVTTAVGLGDPLLARLQTAGIKFEVIA